MYSKIRKVLAMILAVVLAVPSAAQFTLSAAAASGSYEGRNIHIASNTDVVNLTEEYLPQLSDLEQGTISVRYRSNAGQGLSALFSLSSTAAGEQNTYAVAYVNPAGGKAGVEVRSTNPATNYNQVSASADIQDDAWHTVTYVFGASSFQIYVDGQKIADETKNGFFSKISNASSVKVGALDRTAGLNNWVFKGDIDLISVTGQIVKEADILKLHESTVYKKQLPPEPEGSKRTDTRLFYNGYSNSAAYRIPSLLTTKNGVTIAAIDKRQSGSGDQGNIDTMIRRSLDGGLTWEEPQILINLPSGEKRHSLTIDCNMVQDETTGRIFLMADMFPESNAIMDAPTLVTSSGYKTVDGKRYLILRDCPNSATENTYTKEYTIRENGIVWDESTNQPTDYVVPDQTEGTLYQKVNAAALSAGNGGLNTVSQSDVSGNETSEIPDTSRQSESNTTESNTAESDTDNTVSGNTSSALKAASPLTESMKAVGSIFLYTGSNAAPLKVIRTSYLWIVYSDDDGATWSDPVDITGMVKADWMKFSGTGPGRGIQMSDGRLVLPVYVTNSNVGASQSAAVIYSDDHGETWTMGETVNDGIISGGTEHMTGGAMMTESQVVEVTQKDGSKALKLFCRNGGGTVAIATSHDGGATWEDSLPKDSVLKDAYCQLTVMSYPYTVPGYEGKQMFIFANPNSTYAAGRNHGTLRLGYYDENTDSFVWIASRLIESAQYAYSCLSVLEDNKIAVLWEGKDLDINFSTFNLEWLMADQTPINGPAPKVVSINWQNGSIAVEFDQPMLVAGSPVLKAVSGTSSVSMSYESGSGSKVLVFRTDLSDSNRLTFTGIEQSGISSYGNRINQAVADGGFDGFAAEPVIDPNIAGTNAAAGYESVAITFTPSQEATVYEIYRSESQNGVFAKVGTSENGNFVDRTGTGKICWYKVKSQDGTQVSAVFSNAMPTGMEALQTNAPLFEVLNAEFDGSTLVDISDKAVAIKNIANGSVIIKFKTESKEPATAVLLLAKNSTENVNAYGSNRKTAFELQNSGASMFYRADLSHTRANASSNGAVNLADGMWHTAVYSSENGGKTMRTTIDGKELFSYTNANYAGIFNKLSNWDQLTVGGFYNAGSEDVQNGFKGSIAYVAVTDEILSDEGAIAISGMKAPVITAVRPGYSSIQLNLDLPAGDEIYDIYRSDKIDGTYVKIGSTSTASYVDAAGTGVTWYYQVKSQDGLRVSGCMGNEMPTGLEAMKENALIYEDVHETVFDGATLVDISDQAAEVDGLAKGSIIVRFKTDKSGVNAAMLMGKTKGESAQVTGAGNKASVLLENRTGSMCLRADFAHTRASLVNTDSADGEWHTAVIINDTTPENTFRFTLDGKELANFNAGSNNANIGFFSTVNNLNQFTIGGYYNGNSTDVVNGFNGEIAYVLITDEVFTTEEANQITMTENGTVCNISSVMFDQSKDNTWVFTGGLDTAGGFDQTQGIRNYVGQFEEYIRWTKNGGTMGRQRYMINTGKSGRTVSDVTDGFDAIVQNYDPKAVAVLIGQEDWSAGEAKLGEFKETLKSLADEALSLRENTGYLVIQTPFAQSAPADNQLAKAYADAAKEVYEGMSLDQKTRIMLVNHFKASDNDDFKSKCLDKAGHLNAYGHLFLAKDFAKAVYGSTDNFPVSDSSFNLIPAETPSLYLQEFPLVTAEDNSLKASIPQNVLAQTAEWTYELQLADRTISGTFTHGEAVITGLIKDENYVITAASVDGRTQLTSVSGKVSLGNAAQTVSNKQTDLTQQQQDIQKLVNAQEPLTWLFVGDSITHGALHTKGYDSIHQTFEKYLRDEMGRENDVVINTAVSGATSQEQENNSNERLDKFDADVVIIMLGTNDASNSIVPLETYRKNLSSIVDKVQSNGAVAVLRTPNPLRGSDSRAVNLPKYAEVIREVAAAKNVILADHFAEWTKELETRSYLWNNDWWNNDAIHPNPNGQLNMAQSLIRSLGLYDTSSAICNLSYEMPGSKENSQLVFQAKGGENTVTVNIAALETSYGSAFGKVTMKAVNDGTTCETQQITDGTMQLKALPGDAQYQISIVADLRDSAATVTFPVETVSVTNPVAVYMVTFLGKDGTVLKTQEVLKGSSAIAPQAPEVDGYTFKEWDKDFSNVQNDLTVNAVYDKIPVYTVTFLDKDGAVLKTEAVLKGGSATAPQAPEVDGYTFKEWDKNFSNIQNDLTVTAVYESIIAKPSEENKKAMTLLLADAGQKIQGEYTQETWDLFLAAKAAAEKAMATENISQEEFNKTAAELRKAMDNLSKTDSNQGGDDNNGGTNDDNNSNDNRDGSGSGQNNPADQNAPAITSPKTSDSNTEVLPGILLLAMTGLALVALSRKKQKNK